MDKLYGGTVQEVVANWGRLPMITPTVEKNVTTSSNTLGVVISRGRAVAICCQCWTAA
jgi:hypothetical protein